MRLVRDVFIPFLTPPVAARSSVPALLFHFSAGRVNNEICPGPLFFGLHKQLYTAVVLFFELYSFQAITQRLCRVPAFSGYGWQPGFRF